MSAPVMRVLEVADPQASATFYRDILGFTPRSADEAVPAGAVEVVLGAARVQLVPVGSAASARAGPQVAFFQVDDIVGLHAALRARGAAASEPTQVNWIKYDVFELRDPDGHTLWFGQSFDRPHQRTAEPLLEQALPVLPCDDVGGRSRITATSSASASTTSSRIWASCSGIA